MGQLKKTKLSKIKNREVNNKYLYDFEGRII